LRTATRSLATFRSLLEAFRACEVSAEPVRIVKIQAVTVASDDVDWKRTSPARLFHVLVKGVAEDAEP